MHVFDLLRRWAVLEPEWCEAKTYYSTGCNGFWLGVPGQPKYWLGLDEVLTWQDFAKLQYSVQQAIAARRGWDVVLQSGLNFRNEVVYFAIVRHSDGAEFGGNDHAEAAIAPLEAYVAAIEAMSAPGGKP